MQSAKLPLTNKENDTNESKREYYKLRYRVIRVVDRAAICMKRNH